MMKAIAEHLYDTFGDAWCSLEHAKEVYASIKMDQETKELHEMQIKLLDFRNKLAPEIEAE